MAFDMVMNAKGMTCERNITIIASSRKPRTNQFQQFECQTHTYFFPQAISMWKFDSVCTVSKIPIPNKTSRGKPQTKKMWIQTSTNKPRQRARGHSRDIDNVETAGVFSISQVRVWEMYHLPIRKFQSESLKVGQFARQNQPPPADAHIAIPKNNSMPNKCLG